MRSRGAVSQAAPEQVRVLRQERVQVVQVQEPVLERRPVRELESQLERAQVAQELERARRLQHQRRQ